MVSRWWQGAMDSTLRHSRPGCNPGGYLTVSIFRSHSTDIGPGSRRRGPMSGGSARQDAELTPQHSQSPGRRPYWIWTLPNPNVDHAPLSPETMELEDWLRLRRSSSTRSVRRLGVGRFSC
jgi:hypothetical protein